MGEMDNSVNVLKIEDLQACGNVNPNQYRRFEPPAFEYPERMGKLLAAEALKMVELIEVEDGAPVIWNKLDSPFLPMREEALAEEITNNSFKGLKEAK